jgi:hypothetical protein
VSNTRSLSHLYFLCNPKQQLFSQGVFYRCCWNVCLVLFPFDSCFECIFISLYFYFSIAPSNKLFLPMGFLPVLQGSVLSFFFPYSPFFTTAESPTRHSNQPSLCPVALPTGEAGCGGSWFWLRKAHIMRVLIYVRSAHRELSTQARQANYETVDLTVL